MNRFLTLAVLLAGTSFAKAQIVGLEDVPILPGAFVNDQSLVSSGATFHNTYDAMFGSWAGFAASRVTDVITPGWGNQYSAMSAAGGGDGSAQYAVGYFDAFNNILPSVTLPVGTRPSSVRVTNSAYAYYSMRDGDTFAKKFGGATGNDPDYLRLSISGFDSGNVLTGSIEFYLADFRFANNAEDYIIGTWTTVDLSALGDARAIRFGFASSDVGPFGINTPTYVAIDNLTLVAVPEPTSLLLVGSLAAGWAIRRRVSRSR